MNFSVSRKMCLIEKILKREVRNPTKFDVAHSFSRD